MNIMNLIEENMIIITPNYTKNKILSSLNKIMNLKIMSFEELIKKYIFSYRDDTLYYLVKKYNIIPNNAEIIMNNLYYIEGNYSNHKLDYFKEIKDDLFKEHYLIFNKTFKEYLKNKKILIYNYEITKYYQKIIDELKLNNEVIICNEPVILKDKIVINEFDTLEEEVIYLASTITKLINDGVDINKIKLNKLDNAYKGTIEHIFPLFGIPFELNRQNYLYYYEDTKKFLNNLDLNMKISAIESYLNSLNLEDKIYNALISILNKYFDTDTKMSDLYDTLIYELKNKVITQEKYYNIVEEVDMYNYYFEDEYLFILGFNQDYIPLIHQDDLYLSDNERDILKIDISFDLNNLENNRLFNLINKVKDISISYKLETPFDNYTVSSFIDILKNKQDVEINKPKYEYISPKLNDLLLASKLDNLIKYNVKDDDLNDLYTNSTIPYKEYDNKFTGINYDLLKKFLNNKINLSFSNMDNFFKCQFRFYLNDIIKLQTFEETSATLIGKVFHKVLQIVYKDNNHNYLEVIDNVMNEFYKEKFNKDLFYQNKHKEVLLKIIDVLNDQMSHSLYQNSYFEEFFSVNKKNDLQINVIGFIDKIITFKDEENTYVVVVDYKTGALHNNFNLVIHGLDMQLLVYLYLIKNSHKIKNPVFTGMYLQSIMTDIMKSEPDTTYDELLKDNFKLNGYTNINQSILNNFDCNYINDSFIKGIKIKNDGDFYPYSKVLNNDQIDSLIDIVDKNINTVIESLNKGDFRINPKRIGNKLVGCEYCPFKDICYMKNEDIVDLEEYKKLEFLGGETNDTN